MKIKLPMILLAVLLSAPILVSAQEKKEKKEKKAKKESFQGLSAEDQAKMMEQWMKLNAPGEQHAEFKKTAGTWKTVEKHFMGPEPMEGKGTSTMRPILGGRYLLQEYKSESPMGKFEGMGIYAYDNMRKEYVSIWIDNMSTGVFTTYGKKKGDTVTYRGKQKMPDGTTMQHRLTIKEPNPDKIIMTMFGRMPKQKEFSKHMQITYTRVK